MIHTDIDLCRVICPECSGESLIENWRPEECPHCGAGWKSYGDVELKPKEEVISLIIDRLTGHVAVLPLFVGAVVKHEKLPGVKLQILDGPWKTPLGNTQYVVFGEDGKKWAVKKENLKGVGLK